MKKKKRSAPKVAGFFPAEIQVYGQKTGGDRTVSFGPGISAEALGPGLYMKRKKKKTAVSYHKTRDFAWHKTAEANNTKVVPRNTPVIATGIIVVSRNIAVITTGIVVVLPGSMALWVAFRSQQGASLGISI